VAKSIKLRRHTRPMLLALTAAFLLLWAYGLQVRADTPAPVSPPADNSPELRRDRIDHERRSFAESKNRFEIELRLAENDVTDKTNELARIGGENLGTDGCAKSLELKRLVQEQADLRVQKIAVEVELNQLTEIKAQGQVPPTTVNAVETSPRIVHLTEMADSAKTEADTAAAQKQLDQVRAAMAAKAMSDLEASLKWRQQSVSRRMEKIDAAITECSSQLAEITTKTMALALRKDDIGRYREEVIRYSDKLTELDQKLRDLGQ
jgi:chromosome segregation ATPase